MHEIRVSVAMATYNGERYLEEQLCSVLSMLSGDDEIVISDDHSTDRTIDIIKRFQGEDARIYLYVNPQKGIGPNFENALLHCRGKYIFYSDQDDVWVEDKIGKCVKMLEDPQVAIVVHDGYYVDQNLRHSKDNPFGDTLFKKSKMKSNPIMIWIGSAGMLGCCMAFRREYISAVMPFPNDDHDVWTINLLSRLGKVAFLYEKLILHRMHGKNVSVPHRRRLDKVFVSRMVLLARLYIRMIKLKIFRHDVL